MKASAAKRLKELDTENRRLEWFAANLALKIDMLKHIADENC